MRFFLIVFFFLVYKYTTSYICMISFWRNRKTCRQTLAIFRRPASVTSIHFWDVNLSILSQNRMDFYNISWITRNIHPRVARCHILIVTDLCECELNRNVKHSYVFIKALSLHCYHLTFRWTPKRESLECGHEVSFSIAGYLVILSCWITR